MKIPALWYATLCQLVNSYLENSYLRTKLLYVIDSRRMKSFT